MTKNQTNGFDAIIFGDCPLSAGVSSSASIEMASVITFLGINDIKIPQPGIYFCFFETNFIIIFTTV